MDNREWLKIIRNMLEERYRSNPSEENMRLLMKLSNIALEITKKPLTVNFKQGEQNG
jgi:hypothetical protein